MTARAALPENVQMINLTRIFKTACAASAAMSCGAILTTLGIIIGIAAVIAMMEIGKGSSAAIQQTIASMGANNLMILPGHAPAGGVSYGAAATMTLTPQRLRRHAADCPAVAAAAPVVRARAQIVYGNRNWVPTHIYGTTPAYLEVRDWTDMAEGDCFTDQDVAQRQQGLPHRPDRWSRELFDERSPIGKEIRLQNVAFKVVGVLSPRAPT